MTATTDMESIHLTAADLVESFQHAAVGGLFCSPKELYRLGCVLHQLHVMQAENIKHDVQSAYHQLLQSLPQKRLFFDVLHEGLDRLLKAPGSSDHDILSAVQAMDSLYRYSVLCEASHKSTMQTVNSLADYYGKEVTQQSSSGCSSAILSLLFRLLWKSPSHVSLEWEELLPVLEVLQEKRVWKPLASYLDEIHVGWQEAWLEGYDDETQKEYLTSWLRTAAANTEDEQAAKLAQAIARAKPSPKTRPKRVSSAGLATSDPLQRQLDQVRAVLPQYGEGLVELALSLRQGSVEETVALLSSPTFEWPVSLQAIDPALPRRHQKRVASQDADATQRTKEALRAADQQFEREALIMTQFTTTGADEYDDDYDDQWDAVDTAGANDGGLYDDYQAVRTYNRVVRDTEKEAAFWEANANTNKKGTKPSGEAKYRGPDKLKGGRVPKPPPGGNDSKKKSETEPSKEEDEKAQAGDKKDDGKQLTEGKPSRSAQRQKDRKMTNRREKQRQAMNKRGS